MSTCIVYIDESGTPHGHHIPVESSETPIFTLSAIAFPLAGWRERDRGYLSLKRRFFEKEMGASTKRPEEFEVKGNEICSPRNKNSARRHAFNREVLHFISENAGKGFGVTFIKSTSLPMPAMSMYTKALQILVERVSQFVKEHPSYDNAILICDSRLGGPKGLDISVARSHMSFIFGNASGRQFINILEAPMFVNSQLSVGIQLADIFSSNLFTNHYHYYVRQLTGALDYAHMRQYWPEIDALQYKSSAEFEGYKMFGYRVVDCNSDRSENLVKTE
jgi:hypothetical protein